MDDVYTDDDDTVDDTDDDNDDGNDDDNDDTDDDNDDDDDDDDCPPVPELVRSSVVILANSRDPRIDDLATVHELHRCLPGGELLSTQ